MSNKKHSKKIDYSPIYASISLVVISILLYFIINLITKSKCTGNAGCMIIMPIFASPYLLGSYGVSIIISFFIKKNDKLFHDIGVYSLAFWLLLVIGLVALFILLIR